MNKQIFGDLEDRKQVTSVLNTNTGAMILNPEDVVNYVHKTYQDQARPASGMPKSNMFQPNPCHRSYPWGSAKKDSIDAFKPETAAGKPGYGHMSMLRLMQDPGQFKTGTPQKWKVTWARQHPK